MPYNASHSVSFADVPSPRGAFVDQACASVQQMVQAGVPPRDILMRLALEADRLAGPGAAASILVLDADGLLRNGASPQLPADYLAAIDRLKPDATVGTCAAAAATGSVVLTPDFCADDKWSELRHLPCSLGFIGAWSMPIKATDGSVLGTFGTYFRDRRYPTPAERRGVARLAAAAALVLATGCGRTSWPPPGEQQGETAGGAT